MPHKMGECYSCRGKRLVNGRIATSRRGWAVFRPDGERLLSLSVYGGSRFTEEACACLDCVLVWGFTSAEELCKFIQKHCKKGEDIGPSTKRCFRCESDKVVDGRIVSGDIAVFRPERARFFSLSIIGGVRFTGQANACLNCGFVRGSTSTGELISFIAKYCDQTPNTSTA